MRRKRGQLKEATGGRDPVESLFHHFAEAKRLAGLGLIVECGDMERAKHLGQAAWHASMARVILDAGSTGSLVKACYKAMTSRKAAKEGRA